MRRRLACPAALLRGAPPQFDYPYQIFILTRIRIYKRQYFDHPKPLLIAMFAIFFIIVQGSKSSTWQQVARLAAIVGHVAADERRAEPLQGPDCILPGDGLSSIPSQNCLA